MDELGKLRDEIAADLTGEEKDLFLGFVEGMSKSRRDWSENAKKAMKTPSGKLPTSVVTAMIRYLDASEGK